MHVKFNPTTSIVLLLAASCCRAAAERAIKGAMCCLQGKPYKFTCYTAAKAAVTSVLANNLRHAEIISCNTKYCHSVAS